MKSYKRDGTNRIVYSKDMKLIELIDADYELLSILLRMDIQLPFGDVSVEEMCHRYNMSPTLFLMICQIYACADYEPDVAELHSSDLLHVVDYLRASHRYYTGYMLPHVASHLDKVLEHCDKLSERALRSFYKEYVRFLTTHFEEEERNIFSVIDSPAATIAADFSMLEAPHGDIDDRTNDIASLVFKSLPEQVPTPLRCTMLDHIYMLRDDLRRHSDLEMYLLRPLVAKYQNCK
jgi:regulator of cell morphogenesis and NO signaling